jgi:hypothetical protein
MPTQRYLASVLVLTSVLHLGTCTQVSMELQVSLQLMVFKLCTIHLSQRSVERVTEPCAPEINNKKLDWVCSL